MTEAHDVWQPEDPARMAVLPQSLLVCLFLTGAGFVVAVLGSFSVPLGLGISSVWPAMTIQCLGGIWFGGWGVIAGTVFPIFSNMMIVGSPVEFTPSNFLQSFIPAWYFRRFRRDPCLRSWGDLHGFVLVGAILPPLCGALLGNWILYAEGRETWEGLWWGVIRWVPGNLGPCLTFGIPLLKVLSPIITKSNFFCKTMWKSEIRPRPHRRRIADLPILVKLLLGFALAGIVPIMMIALVTIREQARGVERRMEEELMSQADLLAAKTDAYLGDCASTLQDTAGAVESLPGNASTQAAFLARLGGARGGLRELALVENLESFGRQERLKPLGKKEIPFAPHVSIYERDLNGEPEICLIAKGNPPQRPSLFASVDMAPIRSFLSDCAEKKPDAAGGVLLLATGSHLATPDSKARLEDADAPHDRNVRRLRDGTVVGYAPTRALDGMAFVSRNMAAAFEGTLTSQRSMLSFLVTVGMFSAVIVGGYMARHIQRPIELLTQSVRHIGQGQFDCCIQVSGEDEVGQLACAFDQMSKDLKRHVEELREATAAKERMETELKVAARLQKSLLPETAPKVPGFDIHGMSIPAREVGGDYYGYIEFEAGNIGIGIGDASGKGLPAAMCMAQCRAVTVALAMQTMDLSKTLYLTNNMLARDVGDTGMFVTFFASFLDPKRRTLTYSCAGHNPTLLFHRREEPRRLKGNGLPLGIFADCAYAVQTAALRSGDLLLYYTDGVTEAHNARGEMLGEKRLLGLAEKMLAADSAAAAVGIVADEVTAFAHGVPQHDDITIVVVKAV